VCEREMSGGRAGRGVLAGIGDRKREKWGGGRQRESVRERSDAREKQPRNPKLQTPGAKNPGTKFWYCLALNHRNPKPETRNPGVTG
jgi:hypothetical protein